jgi:hypothetical protein
MAYHQHALRTGLTDNELHTSSLTQASEGNFVWTDGTLVDYLDWHPGEPSNNIRADSGAGGEDAVAITFIGDFNGQWNVRAEQTASERAGELRSALLVVCRVSESCMLARPAGYS